MVKKKTTMKTKQTINTKDIKLTRKEDKFIAWILAGKTNTQSALDAYDTTDYSTAWAIASQNLKKIKIMAYLQQISTWAVKRIEQLSKTAKNEWVKYTANKDILDRAGYKPVDKVEATFKVVKENELTD